jgi:hypothetical protein
MSMSRNSAPAERATAGSDEVRKSQPNVPNTGWPARSFFLTGLSRIVVLSCCADQVRVVTCWT